MNIYIINRDKSLNPHQLPQNTPALNVKFGIITLYSVSSNTTICINISRESSRALSDHQGQCIPRYIITSTPVNITSLVKISIKEHL